MKKKIAIFTNGWSNEYVKLVLEGIKNRAINESIDLYAFANYASGPSEACDNIGEASIFKLPDLASFDGVILLTNTFGCDAERHYLSQEVQKLHIPAVSLEYELGQLLCLGTDTYSGMYRLVSHLITDHNVKQLIYVSGPKDNQENQRRMQAVNDALAQIGKQLTPNDIIYGEWSYYETYKLALEWLPMQDALPDAFVCANDEMAIAICSALTHIGKKVPEDTIVTGCDCIEQSQKIYPILSTIAREWDKLGYDALDCVIRQMNGERMTGTIKYDSVPILGESCGCKADSSRLEHRRQSIIANYRNQKESIMNEWHLRHIDDMLNNISSTQELKNCMSWNFSYNHSREGENFLICLVDNFVHDKVFGKYTPQMSVYTYLKDGQDQPCEEFLSKDLLPPLKLNEQDSNFFLFVPLHIEDEIIGYVVFINKQDMLYNQTLYTWARHLSQDLDRVRKNIHLEELNQKLTEVSMTDALTGLKNRTGYDSLAFPYLQKCQQEGKLGCMIFADINRMKLINDQYGHLQGDIALCTVADAIKLTMPPDWIAVRFGGDEFIMVGECKDSNEAEELKNRLSENLEQIKKERDLRFSLTASFGAVVMNPQENYSLEEYLRKADEAMYVMKQQTHAEE